MIRNNAEYRAARRNRKRSRPSREKPPHFIDIARDWTNQQLDQLWSGNNPRDLAQLHFGYQDPSIHYPILLHRNAYNGHLLALGMTGGGKTALMISQAIQLTRQNRRLITAGQRASTIIVVDLKPDRTFFQALRHAATHPDGMTRPIPFKFLTIEGSNEPTMPFNQFEQKFFKEKTRREQAEFIVPAMERDHGLGYGEGHFTEYNYYITERLLEVEQPSSFRDLACCSRLTRKQFTKRFQLEPEDFSAMRSMFISLQRLARVPQFNVSAANPLGLPKSAIDNAIDFGEALLPGNEQVIYVAANSTLQHKTAPTAASLVMASVIDAANHYRTKDTNRVVLFADDIQKLASGNNITEWLQKCRGAKCSLFLGTQTLGNWPPSVQHTIVANTNVKAIFNAADAVLVDELIRMSATKKEPQVTYNQSTTVGETPRGSTWSVTSGTSTSYKDVPRINPNDVANINWDKSRGALIIHSEIPGSRYRATNGAAMPIYRSFPFPQEEHDAMGDAEYPNDPGTFVPAHYPELMADPVFSSPQPSVNRNGNGSKTSRKGNGPNRQDKSQRREAEATEFADVFEEMMSEDFPG